MFRPQVLGIGHITYEMCQSLSLTIPIIRSTSVALDGYIIDKHQVELHSVNLIVFKGSQHLLGESAALHAVNLHQQYCQVTTDSKTP